MNNILSLTPSFDSVFFIFKDISFILSKSTKFIIIGKIDPINTYGAFVTLYGKYLNCLRMCFKVFFCFENIL